MKTFFKRSSRSASTSSPTSPMTSSPADSPLTSSSSGSLTRGAAAPAPPQPVPVHNPYPGVQPPSPNVYVVPHNPGMQLQGSPLVQTYPPAMAAHKPQKFSTLCSGCRGQFQFIPISAHPQQQAQCPHCARINIVQLQAPPPVAQGFPISQQPQQIQQPPQQQPQSPRSPHPMSSSPSQRSSIAGNTIPIRQSQYGQVVPTPPARSSVVSSPKVTATFEYFASNPDELSFNKGDEFVVIRKGEDGWWMVSREDGVKGLVPGNFMRPSDETTYYTPSFTTAQFSPTVIGSNSDQTIVNTTREISLPGFLLLHVSNDIRVEQALGSGGAGDIFKGTIINPDLKKKNGGRADVVVKKIRDLKHLNPQQNRDLFHQEVSIMWSVSFHPNVVTLLGYSDSPPLIVTEKLETDLLQIIVNQPSLLSPPVAARILFQISSAMVDIHRHGIIHRDLKSANILVQNISDRQKVRIAVCDFGIARNVSETRLANQRVLNMAGYSLMYTSPEAFARLTLKNFNPDVEEEKKTDVYSFAIIAYECINQKRAWDGTNSGEIQHLVRSGKRPECKPEVLRDAILAKVYDVMVGCWDEDFARRPTFNQIHDKLKIFK